VLPLVRPTDECCVGKQLLFVVSFERHSFTVWAECRGRSVKPSGTYSYRCAFRVNTLLPCVLFDDGLAARKTAAVVWQLPNHAAAALLI
jgi:hypothetical protein